MEIKHVDVNNFVCNNRGNDLDNAIVDYKNKHVRLVHYVCENSVPEIIKIMIDNGVNMDVPNFYKWKPIHILCKRPNSDILRYVIERCGGIEETTCEGLKPIHILCEHSILKIGRAHV